MAHYMATFDTDFAAQHAHALFALARCIGVEYFQIDCGEATNVRLLVFEADHTAIVHDMDRPDVFPKKIPQIRKISDAFVAMLSLDAEKFAGGAPRG